MLRIILTLLAIAAAAPAASKKKPSELSPIDAYIQSAQQRAQTQAAQQAGSLWSQGAALGDLARDLKAGQVDDLVTILVAERASAVAKGSTKTARESSAKHSASSLFGLTRVTGPLTNMLDVTGSQSLSGEGATSRENVLTTTLSARVTHVLPNGFLVLEGAKQVMVNSEMQTVIVRGIARPFDVSPGNLVRSDRLAQLEVRINGKGVVGDAVRRPNFLYRLLLGLLPF